MELKYNVTGADRKRLVHLIAEITECDVKYLGAPSFAYQVDYFTIDKNGSITFDDRTDSEEIEQIIERLYEAGFTAENAELDKNRICISMPLSLFTDTALENLKSLVTAKGALINCPSLLRRTRFASPGSKALPTRRRSKPMKRSSASCVKWLGIRNGSMPPRSRPAMRSTHSAASCSAWASSALSIRKPVKSCSAT